MCGLFAHFDVAAMTLAVLDFHSVASTVVKAQLQAQLTSTMSKLEDELIAQVQVRDFQDKLRCRPITIDTTVNGLLRDVAGTDKDVQLIYKGRALDDLALQSLSNNAELRIVGKLRGGGGGGKGGKGHPRQVSRTEFHRGGMQATSGAADDQARVAPPRKYFPPASVADWVAPDRQLWVGWSIKECRYYRPELECMRCGSTLYANRAVCGRTIDFCMRCHLDKDNNYDPIKVYWDPQELPRYKTYPIWLLRPEEFVVCPNLGVYQSNESYKLELRQFGL